MKALHQFYNYQTVSVQILGLPQDSSLGITARIGHIQPKWPSMEDLQEVGEAMVAIVVDMVVVLADTIKEEVNETIFCTHCGRYKHTRETCWDIVGRNHTASTAPTEFDQITCPNYQDQSIEQGEQSWKEEPIALRQRLAALERHLTLSVGMTSTSLNLTALASSLPTPTWAIDSGATDHVTCMRSLFQSYTLSARGNVKISNAPSQKWRETTIIVLPNLSFSSILHVSQFSFNLVSISSLTKNHDCSVTFFPSHYVFQDLRTEQTVGGGKETNGLYILEPIS